MAQVYKLYLGPSPNDRLLASIFGGEVDPHKVTLSWTWEGRRYEALLDEDPAVLEQWVNIIKGPGPEVQLRWGRDIYRPKDGRRGIVRLTLSGRRAIDRALKAARARREEEQRRQDREFVTRLLQMSVTFDPDGGVRAADGSYNSPEELRATLPRLRPWNRAGYVLRALAAARAKLPNAEAHLHLVLETIGLSGQGQLWDQILFGTPEEAGKAFERAFPGFDPEVVSTFLMGDDE